MGDLFYEAIPERLRPEAVAILRGGGLGYSLKSDQGSERLYV